MLESFFKGILNISLYATVVAVAVVFIKIIFGKRLSPNFHYGIWFLFLFKLVFPFELKSVLSIFTLFDRIAPEPVTDQINTVLPPITTGVFVPSANLHSPNSAAEMPAAANGLDLWNVAAVLWFTGIIIMLAALVFSYIKTSKILKTTSEKPDSRLLGILSICKTELTIRCNIPVYTTGSFSIPFIFGFIKPMIILPVHIYNKLPDAGIKAILLHELMHIKRKDYLVNLILFLFKAVYWFNPIVWLAFAWMKNDAERACDSAVVKEYPTEKRGEYAKALLDVAACVGKRTYIPAISAFTEGNFKERIKNVLKGRRYSFMAASIAVVVFVAAGVILLTGAQAKSENADSNIEAMGQTDDNSGQQVLRNSIGSILYAELAKQNNVDLFALDKLSTNERDKKLFPVKVGMAKIASPLNAANELLTRYLSPEAVQDTTTFSFWPQDIQDAFNDKSKSLSPSVLRQALTYTKNEMWGKQARILAETLSNNPAIAAFIEEVDNTFSLALSADDSKVAQAQRIFDDLARMLDSIPPAYGVTNTQKVVGSVSSNLLTQDSANKTSESFNNPSFLLPNVTEILTKMKADVDGILGEPYWYGPFTGGWRLKDTEKVVSAYQGRYSLGNKLWLDVNYIDNVARHVDIRMTESENYLGWRSQDDSERVLLYFGIVLPKDKKPDSKYVYEDSVAYTNVGKYWRAIAGGHTKGQGSIWVHVTSEEDYRQSEWY